MLMPERIILWDVDGTIVRESLERQFLRFLLKTQRLRKAELVRRVVRLRVQFPLLKWYQIKLAYLIGDREVDIEIATRRFFDEVAMASIHDGITDLIRLQSESGVRQVLLTGTPGFLAAPLAAFLGIKDVISAIPEVVDGRFTGALIEPQPAGSKKRIRAQEWLEANHYDWRQVIALADHHNDCHLLKAAKTAIAVNPTHRLRAYAQWFSWPAVDGKNLATQLSDLLNANTSHSL